MVEKLRFKIAYLFLRWGVAMVPNPDVRGRIAWALGTAAKIIDHENSVRQEQESS